MQIPPTPYVALYGSNSGDWRVPVVSALDDARVHWFDPTTPEWDAINWENGDALQPTIDRLVQREQDALEGAACVLWYIARRVRRDGQETGETTIALASRLELGVVLGRGSPTFVVIEDDVVGRNYLRAVVRRFGAKAIMCESLDEATSRVIAFFTDAPSIK
jgi:hypothetical protein